MLSPNKSLSRDRNIHAAMISQINKQNRYKIKLRWLYEAVKINPPCVVSLHRLYNPSKSEKRWDEDNWIIACKSLKDDIANLINPGLPRGHADHEKYGIKFKYDQITAPTKGVRITIRTHEEETYVAG